MDVGRGRVLRQIIMFIHKVPVAVVIKRKNKTSETNECLIFVIDKPPNHLFTLRSVSQFAIH